MTGLQSTNGIKPPERATMKMFQNLGWSTLADRSSRTPGFVNATTEIICNRMLARCMRRSLSPRWGSLAFRSKLAGPHGLRPRGAAFYGTPHRTASCRARNGTRGVFLFACRYVGCGGFPRSGINFVNIPLRHPDTRGIKDYPSRVVWLAGRFIRISRRSSGIK